MDATLARKIGTAARKARDTLGFSQADAAERIGISPEFYGRIERGVTLPSTPTLVAMAEGLEVSTDVLLGRTAGKQVSQRAARVVAETPEVRRLMRRVRNADARTVRLLGEIAGALLRGR